MKNWLSIGQFSKKVSLTQRTLRVYESAGLIHAYIRGENNYRYYTEEQVEVVQRIKHFKSFGFSLTEIKSLLEVDTSMNPDKLENHLRARLLILEKQKSHLHFAQENIHKILASLKKSKPGLGPHERRFIMSQLDKISVVIAGVHSLEQTAQFVVTHLENAGKKIPVTLWDGKSVLPKMKPYIVVIQEELLSNPEVKTLNADIVVIKELSTSSKNIQSNYLQLYKAVGPHMSTILNADDRAVVEMAANEDIRKGKTYYFSQNSALENQISRIGGAISQSDVVKIFNMNQSPGVVEIKVPRILGHVEEVAYLASLVAIMDLGLNPEQLQMSL